MGSTHNSAVRKIPFSWTGSSSDSEYSESERGPGLASIVDVHEESESCDDGGRGEGSDRFCFRSEAASAMADALADSAMFFCNYLRSGSEGSCGSILKGRQECIGGGKLMSSE